MIFKKFNKNLLTLLHAEAHEVDNIKEEIKTQEGKIQQKLLWSNIAAVWSYLILVLVIVRFYGSSTGKHSFVLFASLFVMYALLTVLMYVIRKSSAYQKVYLKKKSKIYLESHIRRLSYQCRVISIYLIVYAVLLAVSSVFFYLDISTV